MIPVIAFYVFSFLLLLCSLCVVTVSSSVHAVCFLILAFINGAGLFLLAGAEFLSMILAIVYVGAVAVLFLFVVMMLGAPARPKRSSFSYVIGGVLLGLSFGGQVIIMVSQWDLSPNVIATIQGVGPTNAHTLGSVIYTTYMLPFQMAGIILLIAMIGAIVLTFRVRGDVRRQVIQKQIERTATVKLVQIPLGKGM